MCIRDYVCPIQCYSGIILHIHSSQLLIITSGILLSMDLCNISLTYQYYSVCT